MPVPQEVDYLTDEESEGDNQPFDLKIPNLEGLIVDFEKGDEILDVLEQGMQATFAEKKTRGFEKGLREEIVHEKTNQTHMFDSNISAQRAQYASVQPGMLEDLNEVIRKPINKIYLR